MKIQYTLPGLDFRRSGPETSEAQSASFSSRLRRLKQSDSPGWREVLRLNRGVDGAGTIGPPPKPGTLTVDDAATERLRWRSLIFRDPGTADRRVSRMLDLLRDHQAMEDAIVARHLAETRG